MGQAWHNCGGLSQSRKSVREISQELTVHPLHSSTQTTPPAHQQAQDPPVSDSATPVPTQNEETVHHLAIADIQVEPAQPRSSGRTKTNTRLTGYLLGTFSTKSFTPAGSQNTPEKSGGIWNSANYYIHHLYSVFVFSTAAFTTTST